MVTSPQPMSYLPEITWTPCPSSEYSLPQFRPLEGSFCPLLSVVLLVSSGKAPLPNVLHGPCVTCASEKRAFWGPHSFSSSLSADVSLGIWKSLS